MKNTELKNALISGMEVKNTQHNYQGVVGVLTAIIYRHDGKGGISVSVELRDKSLNTLYVCDPNDLEVIND